MKQCFIPLFIATLVSFSIIPVTAEEQSGDAGIMPKKGSFALAVSTPLVDSGSMYLQYHVSNDFALRPGLSVSVANQVDSYNPAGDLTITTSTIRISLAGLYHTGTNDFIRGYFGAEAAVAGRFDAYDDRVELVKASDGYVQFSITPSGGAHVQIHRYIGLFAEAGIAFSFGGTGNALFERSGTFVSTFTQRIGALFYFKN